MSDRVFLDTNLLIYLYSESEPEKRTIVYRIFDNSHCITSLQALNEACNVWYRKYGWDGVKVYKHLDNIERLCNEVLMVGRSTINQALLLKDRFGYSYYDCLMLSSALGSNCCKIMTEDMKDGQIINDTLKIVNPFRQAENQ